MLIDAFRRQEWMWVIFMVVFPYLHAVLYFFLVYRNASPVATRGFELPGMFNRKLIKQLQGQIYHLDKAHHHAELGDIYFQQGKLKEAEICYRNAIERDGSDLDFQAHLGQCLLRQGRPEEARPLLEKVYREKPDHDYGHSMMAYAETLKLAGDKEGALAVWRKVLEQHSYARARVQFAELLVEMGQTGQAIKELHDLLADEAHATNFQIKRDKIWVRRAAKLLKELKK